MLRSLLPLAGCGLMMAVCMTVMNRAGRARTDNTASASQSAELAELRDEVTP